MFFITLPYSSVECNSLILGKQDVCQKGFETGRCPFGLFWRVSSPEVGAVRPATMESNVDFPQPEGPKIETNSPSLNKTISERSCPSNSFHTFFIVKNILITYLTHNSHGFNRIN